MWCAPYNNRFNTDSAWPSRSLLGSVNMGWSHRQRSRRNPHSPVLSRPAEWGPQLRGLIERYTDGITKEKIMGRETIDHFFKPPNIVPKAAGMFSVLYLLRRDIFICFSVHPDDNRSLSHGAQWPGTMAVLAGIDLLGKFYAGLDDISGPSGSGPRFKLFIKDNFEGVSEDDDEIIYQLRNALLHSFGLYSKNRANNIYKFALHTSGEKLIVRHPDNLYQVNVALLWNKFEKAVKTYYEKLIISEELKNKFEGMLPNYGWVSMTPKPGEPDRRTSGFGGPET